MLNKTKGLIKNQPREDLLSFKDSASRINSKSISKNLNVSPAKETKRISTDSNGERQKNKAEYSSITNAIDQYCISTIQSIIFPPAGILPYHYITPSKPNAKINDRELGNYAQQYDWDTYFIGVAMSQNMPEKMKFFKEALLNFLTFTTPSGKTPRTISPSKIWDPYDQHKPFFAQGCLLASRTLDDFTWLNGWPWDRLVSFIHYWEETQGFHGLVRWRSALESGPDNNPTILHLPNYTAESVDASTYLYMEFIAMSKLAKMLGKEYKIWQQKAVNLKTRIGIFWNEKDEIYYDIMNFSERDTDYIRVRSWTCFMPLWAGIPTKRQTEKMLKRYILNEDEFLAPYGLRSIPISDPIYNTAKRYQLYEISEKRRRVISNWQGPIWVIANWIITMGIARYGYRNEAEMIARRVLNALANDLSTTGTLHENYNPETGEGLWSPNFGSWNLLAQNWLQSLKENYE